MVNSSIQDEGDKQQGDKGTEEARMAQAMQAVQAKGTAVYRYSKGILYIAFEGGLRRVGIIRGYIANAFAYSVKWCWRFVTDAFAYSVIRLRAQAC